METDLENRLSDTVEEGKGGRSLENSMETYITLSKRVSQWELTVGRRELKTSALTV